MTKSNNHDAIVIQCNMMKLTGAWPEINPTVWYRIRGATGFIFLIILGITMLMQAYHDRTDLIKLSDILYIMITVISNAIKYASILYIKRKTFMQAISLLKNPLFMSYPDDLDYLMVRRINALQIMVQIFRFFILVCVLLMSISPFFDKQPLPFPFSYELGKFHWVMFIFQSVTVCLVGWNNAFLDTIPASLIGIAITQLEILANKIKRLRDRSNSTTNAENEEFSAEMDAIVVEKLKECIRHHLAIIHYVEYIDGVFSFSTFTQFLSSAVVICNTLFRFILVPVGSSQFFTLVIYVGLVFAELFMFCWFGNEIIWKSTSIGDACYECNWYYCGNGVRKYLSIILERTKRPLTITAFKFSTLSLRAFTSIIQWSYSYFALLLKLYRG